MAEAEDPGFLGLHDPTFSRREVRSAGEERRQPAAGIQPGESLCVHTHLGAVENFFLALARANVAPEKRGVDLGDHRRRVGRSQAGLEGPDGGTARDARVRHKALERGQAQQHLRADGAGIGELPDGLGALCATVGDAALGRLGFLPRARRSTHGNRRVAPRGRAAPEWADARIGRVDRRRDRVTIVVVVRPVLDLHGQPVPEREGRCFAGQTFGNTRRITEGKVEAHQHPPA